VTAIYRIVALTPGAGTAVLHIDLIRDADLARLEPVVVHVAAEELTHPRDGGIMAAHLLPVPASLYTNSSNLGDIIESLAVDRWYEVRPADVGSALARLAEAFPCADEGCVWERVAEPHAAIGILFRRRHAEPCPSAGEVEAETDRELVSAFIQQ
jgi:hypothetical protein